jgi:hypothetical protein
MRVFQCACGQPLFFENLRCLRCGSACGYEPAGRALQALTTAADGTVTLQRETREPAPRYRYCGNRERAAACNWLVPADSGEALCASCLLTRMIPDQSNATNIARLRKLEAAKRRVLFGVQELGLPIRSRREDEARGLAFDMLEEHVDAPVTTGHAVGVITLNVAEADDDFRERSRAGLAEPYRTVIGHLRHELGHYFWDVLVRYTDWLRRFRALFGDERADYADALARHYACGPPPDWQSRFISSYATSHPWEDWAESWAHYMHMRSTLQTASQFGLGISNAPLRTDTFTDAALYGDWPATAQSAFLGWVNDWVALTAVLNEVSRSMGRPDLYPFVLNGPAVTKLHFVHCVIHGVHIGDSPNAR